MPANTTLRIDKLVLSSFRCFTDIAVDFDPTLTVLVADNAQGKTALLNAISIALDVFVFAIGDNKQCLEFVRSDIHRAREDGGNMVLAPIVKFSAQGFAESHALTWGRSLSSHSPLARNSRKDVKPMREAAESMRAQLDDSGTQTPLTLPSVAFYGTGRLWDEHRLTEGKRWLATARPSRFSAYLDCLSPSSSFKTFATWYEETANALRSSTDKTRGSQEKPETLLAAVRKAVEVVLKPTGWTKIDWEFPALDENMHPQGRGHLAVEHDSRGRLPLSMMSDGVRNMVALVGDLAHRCARLNPHFGEDAASRTPGILLIDEIDMHLHPGWQQLVVGLLQEAFPAMQMVLTTHSPQVLTTVRKEHIRMIVCDKNGKWSADMPLHSPLGHEPGDALAFVMGVDAMPPLDILDDVQDYEQWARAGKTNSIEALGILSRLNQAGFEFNDAQKALFAFLSAKLAREQELKNG